MLSILSSWPWITGQPGWPIIPLAGGPLTEIIRQQLFDQCRASPEHALIPGVALNKNQKRERHVGQSTMPELRAINAFDKDDQRF